MLVNKAGIGRSFAAEDEPLDHSQRVLDVNMTGLFQLTQLIGRWMIAAGGGFIVDLGSILGLVAAHPSNQVSYSASKDGVTQLTRELPCQWGSAACV